MDPDRPTSLPPHLRLVRPLGSGGSATVFLGRDRRAGRDVAVKVLEVGSDPANRARFEHEARALARLATVPGVVAVRSMGVGEDGVAWIVCDLMTGGSLADRLHDGPLAEADVAQVGRSVAAALGRAHDLDVIHGDVTPANVLFDDRGVARLADFGMASLGDPAPAVDGGTGAPPRDRAVTPAFAAPERRAGDPATAASDVYGMGATLWAASCGTPPAGPAAPAPVAVPRRLHRVLAPCIASDPAARPGPRQVAAGLADLERRTGRSGRRPAFGRLSDG